MDITSLRWIRLGDFHPDLSDEDGLVCTLGDEPVLQIDFLSEAFTLFWLGTTTVNRFFFAFNDLFSGIARENANLISFGSYSGDAVAVLEKPTTRSNRTFFTRRTETVNYLFNDSQVDAHLLRNEMQPLLGFDSSRVASLEINFDHWLKFGRRMKLSFWADTHRSPKREKEVGITSNLVLGDSFRYVLYETSPKIREVEKRIVDEIINQISNAVELRGFKK